MPVHSDGIKMEMEEEQAENTNIDENQNDTNVMWAENQNGTNVMDSEDNQGEKTQVMTAPCTDPQTNCNKPKRNARRHLGVGASWVRLGTSQQTSKESITNYATGEGRVRKLGQILNSPG